LEENASILLLQVAPDIQTVLDNIDKSSKEMSWFCGIRLRNTWERMCKEEKIRIF